MTKPIIPWPGGKRRLADDILSRIPPHTCYVEAFAGGLAILMAKQPSSSEVANDVNGELVNLYRVVQVHLEEFVRQFKWALSSRQIFKWEQMRRPETLTDIQRAARFYYLQRLSFGGKVDGQSYGTATTSPPKLNLLRLEEDLSAAHLRLSNVNIENLSWLECCERYDRKHTVHYCDPPYWQTEGYGVEFSWGQYEALFTFARECQGMVLISINDHPDIRVLAEGLHLQEINITYTIGGGAKATPAKELLLWNDNCAAGMVNITQSLF